MNQRRRALLPAILLLTALTLVPARAQTAQRVTAADPLQLLPASDVVAVMDHRRILDEAIPRLFGKNPAPLAKIFAAGEEFKAKTGIDPRTINRVALGLRFVNPEVAPEKMDKKDFAIIIIAQGDFDATKLIAALRREEKDKVRQETYQGQVIYTLDERPKGSTQSKLETETPALAVLDANTFALGDLAQMHATVDARAGSNRLSPDLLALVTRNSTALISLAGNVPPSLTAALAPKGSSGNDELDKTVTKFFEAVASIKQAFMSTGLAANGIEARLGARFSRTETAQSLGDLLLGARQQYSVFIEDKIIRELVNSIEITAQGDEVQLRVEIPQTFITTMFKDAGKTESATAVKPTVKPAGTTMPRKKTRRTTRRRRG